MKVGKVHEGQSHDNFTNCLDIRSFNIAANVLGLKEVAGKMLVTVSPHKSK